MATDSRCVVFVCPSVQEWLAKSKNGHRFSLVARQKLESLVWDSFHVQFTTLNTTLKNYIHSHAASNDRHSITVAKIRVMGAISFFFLYFLKKKLERERKEMMMIIIIIIIIIIHYLWRPIPERLQRQKVCRTDLDLRGVARQPVQSIGVVTIRESENTKQCSSNATLPPQTTVTKECSHGPPVDCTRHQTMPTERGNG